MGGATGFGAGSITGSESPTTSIIDVLSKSSPGLVVCSVFSLDDDFRLTARLVFGEFVPLLEDLPLPGTRRAVDSDFLVALSGA